MPLRDSFKEHYLLESARRNELTSALAVPIAILTVVLGAVAVIAKDLHAPLDSGATVQLTLVVLAAAACALCTYFLFRSLYGLAYAFVPTPQELADYRGKLVVYHLALGRSAQDASSCAETETLDYLYAEYAKNAHRNSINNDIKSGFIHNANSALIGGVVLAGLAGVSYVYASVNSPAQIQKMEIVKMPTTPLSAASHPQAATSNPTPPPPPPPPVRPEAPPSRVVREHVTPPAPPVPPRR